jgi:L-threonylcarbamoyladenylate synthase
LLKHYSPDAELLLNQNKPNKGDIFLSFGPHPKEIDGLTLTESKNLEEAAKNLFTFLHILDRLSKAKGGVPIKVAPIPSIGVGAAINDRLLRAVEK